MKVKQQTLKGFECEVESTEDFIQYYTKNAPLMQGHLLILQGKVTAEVKAYLDEKKAPYVDANERPLQTRKKRSTAVLQELKTPEVEVEKTGEKTEAVSMVFHRTIRSGEAIHIDENLVFFGRINSGALVETTKSVQSFGIIDGIIRSEGEFLIIKNIGLGSVIFHGEELDRTSFNGELKLVEYKNSAIEIKDI